MADPKALLLVQEEQYQEYNKLAATLDEVDLSCGQFRGYDLRKFHLANANLSESYLRNADLRGLDLSQAKLRGASLKGCKISGVLFPETISPEEIRLSLDYGTRLRERSL